MKEYLTEREKRAVRRIVKACNRLDGTTYSAPLDGDEYFLSFHGKECIAFLCVYRLGETVGGRDAEELLLFTDPKERGKGRAGRLLKRYLKTREEMPVLRFSAYPSEVSNTYLCKLNATHDHDELMMVRELGGSGKLKPSEKTVREEHSECGVRTFGNTCYIYGIRTDAGHLRKGNAERLLRKVLKEAEREGAGLALLQVSSGNIPALRLYEKLGFVVSEALGIWNVLNIQN